MLEAKGLTKRFGKMIAVGDVSFQVEPGDAFGLLGPNGAGKSTTISLLTGLLAPDEGEVLLQGKSLAKHPKFVKSRLGLVPQSIALHEHLNAYENLAFWGAIYGVSGSKLKDSIDWCIDVSGLKDHAKQLVKSYSGGMKRRLNIAVAMIHRPEVLIMDEPTVGIDPQSRNHILETVKALNHDGMTVIYTSHYMEEVEYLCQRLAIMDHGKVIAYGNLQDVRRLAGSLSTVRIEANSDVDMAVLELRQESAISQVQSQGNSVTLLGRDAAAVVSQAVIVLARHQLQPTRIQVQEPNLETAFLHLTGRQLRDDNSAEGNASTQGVKS